MRLALPLTHPLHLVLGLVIWGAWLGAVYGGLSLGCMVAAAPNALGRFSWINVTLLAFTLMVVALLLVLAVRCWRKPADDKVRKFIVRVAAAIYFAASAATLAVGMPILVLPPCV